MLEKWLGLRQTPVQTLNRLDHQKVSTHIPGGNSYIGNTKASYTMAQTLRHHNLTLVVTDVHPSLREVEEARPQQYGQHHDASRRIHYPSTWFTLRRVLIARDGECHNSVADYNHLHNGEHIKHRRTTNFNSSNSRT